jgi:steroid 5-alpha reductase family enzyme
VAVIDAPVIDAPVIDAGGFGLNLAVTAGAVTVLMAGTFLLARRLGRHSVVDTAWGLGFAAVALITFGMSAGHGDFAVRCLATALTVVWGCRLAGHIGLRSRGQDEDPRYRDLLAPMAGHPVAGPLQRVYLPQGLSMWFVSLPVQTAQYLSATSTTRTAVLLALGGALWLVGFLFEAVGDLQLTRFRADRRGREVLDTGLWRYTRHPNYFGDACVWWGLYLIACVDWPGALTILSPAAMTYFLTAKTGKPLMEAYLARTRPAYADYVARTSPFLPRRPAPKA